MNPVEVKLIRKIGGEPQTIRRAGDTPYVKAPCGAWVRITPKHGRKHAKKAGNGNHKRGLSW